MKNIFVCFVVMTSLLAVSCKKENTVKPQSPVSAVKSINVEYKIVSETGNVNISYLAPDENGKLISTEKTINRTDYSVFFTSTEGNFFSISAENVMPARKAVHVQIIVDGVLFQEGASNSPSQKAIAQGNYNN